MLIWKNKRGSNRSDEYVKRRSRFESRRFRRYEADEDGSDVELPKSMSDLDKSVGYDEFVEILDANASDPKAKAWLQYAFGKGKKEEPKLVVAVPDETNQDEAEMELHFEFLTDEDMLF